MSYNYRTDLDNLNRLYQINQYYNSPQVIKNFKFKDKNNYKKLMLEKSVSLPYFPTQMKLLKKSNFNSPKENKTKEPIFSTYAYRTNTHFYPKNRDQYINHIMNQTYDYTHPYNRTKYKKLEKPKNLDYSFGTPEVNDNINYNKFIPTSPSYDQFDDNRSRIKTYRPYHTENEFFKNNMNNNNFSFITDINQYRQKQFNKSILNNSLYKQSKNNTIKDNIFINNNIYYTDPNLDLDDLIIMEEKFNDILIVLNNIRYNLNINALNECVEFYLFYFNSSLKDKFIYFFSEQNHIIIHSATNVMLFMILITYHLSLNPNMLAKAILILNKIFDALKVNLYLFVKKIELYYGDLFCNKNEIYFNKFNYFLIKNDIYDISEREIIDIICRNCVHTVNDAFNILNYYRAINNRYYYDFHNIYLSLSRLNEEDLNDYLFNNILNTPQENLNKTVKYYYNDDNNNIDNYILETPEEEEDEEYLNNIILLYKKNKAIPPFLKYKTFKKYTLVIDLGGTLVNVKMDNKGGTICYMRPGIIAFLEGIKPYYEIVAYTKLSKDYSSLIIQQIERNRKLFDYNLCRDHCALVGNKFIKDISRIGRDIKKIIMVDDVPENLEKYYENGILILPYEGEEDDENDRVLFELKKLLILFYKLGYEDLRTAIKSYQNDIYNKITLGNIDY